jgi:hypothetical protein
VRRVKARIGKFPPRELDVRLWGDRELVNGSLRPLARE